MSESLETKLLTKTEADNRIFYPSFLLPSAPTLGHRPFRVP